MFDIIGISLKGMLRDRILHGILVVAVFFLVIPVSASLSMRQVVELALTLSLSLVSVILFMLAVFLGGTSLWRDLERRYIFSVLGLPVRRTMYVTGKFLAVAMFLMSAAAILGFVAALVVFLVGKGYPPERPIQWLNFVVSVGFDSLKFVLLCAFAFLFSTVSTSFFLPICGTVAVFLVGNASQEAYDFLHSPNAESISPLVKSAATILYYLLPNFSAFNFKVNAIYGLPLSLNGICLTVAYFLVYTSAVISLACIVFAYRELK